MISGERSGRKVAAPSSAVGMRRKTQPAAPAASCRFVSTGRSVSMRAICVEIAATSVPHPAHERNVIMTPMRMRSVWSA